ncbi:hypothetical protein [Paraburkholderia dinghuensis]|uniref:Radical SAM protein n=1 Tax=Paraburkholderia dinghuensis TaxID=2305225 RepID=A0A3N6P186_9BURK|nr:hypothetical protein [Paraburkholderia dinghuensis]RQH07123.1 hypothetical protein D1Y85_10725 [Paraburkholderia dinghuensis]
MATNKKKLLLIYPPLTMPTAPPIGAPLLKGYIECELPEWEVKVIGLNIWSYGVLFERIRDGSLKFAPNTFPRGASDVEDLLRIADFFLGKGPDDFYLDGESYDRYGTPLERNYSPVPVVPLLLSRGCCWRRCTFCVHYMSAGLTYRVHGLEHTIETVQH